MNGTLFAFKICITSAVCGLIPSLMSITRIAKSARLPPRFLKLLNAACPGVSMNKKPGISKSILYLSISGQLLFKFSAGKRVNEIFCVMFPASSSATSSL